MELPSPLDSEGSSSSISATIAAAASALTAWRAISSSCSPLSSRGDPVLCDRDDRRGAGAEAVQQSTGSVRLCCLGLRLLAPTVAIATSPLDVLLPRLRELGAAPVVEAADGTVRVSRPDLQRARARRGRRPAGAVEARQAAQVQAVATAIRAGDRAESSRPASAEATTTPSDALAALREAIEAGSTVVIGYVDGHGANGERVVDPRRLDGGRLSAYDHRADDVREFAVHRITGVRRA